MNAEIKEAFEVRKLRINERLKQLHKVQREAEKAGQHHKARELGWDIEHLQNKRTRLYGARALPVRFQNGLVVDGNLLKKWLRKLPTGLVIAEVDAQCLSLQSRSGKQKIALKNQAEHYGKLNLPSGEALLEELGVEMEADAQ